MLNFSFFVVVFYGFIAYVFCMKKNKKRKVKFIFAVFSKMAIISLLVGIMIIAPTFGVVYHSRKKLMEEKMFGKKAEFQGVITLWNVDTFEGGTSSRSAFLESVAVNFEKQNKGAFIKVESLTINEMLANIKMGKLPNLFSFGTGIAGYLEKDMKTLSNDFSSKVKPNFLAAGLSRGNLKALPWNYGGYGLITTTEKIEKAKLEPVETLDNIAFNLAYDKIFKKSTKHIYSLTFGKNDYVNGLDVFSRHFTNKSAVELSQNGIIDERYNLQSPYDAYVNFVSGKSSMLLGTQRDIARMENRINAGNESDFLFYALGEYTDLVCYISVIKSQEAIEKVCSNFIEYLLSETIQKKLVNIGMLSPTNLKLYQDGAMGKLEESITEKTLVKSAF